MITPKLLPAALRLIVKIRRKNFEGKSLINHKEVMKSR